MNFDAWPRASPLANDLCNLTMNAVAAVIRISIVLHSFISFLALVTSTEGLQATCATALAL